MILVERTPKSYNISKIVNSQEGEYKHIRYDKAMTVGSEWKTKYGYCTVLKVIDYDHIKVKFNSTGYVNTYKFDKIIDDAIKDYMYPKIYGVGYLGEDCRKIRKKYGKLAKIAYNIWRYMIRRCYDKLYKSYSQYGGLGITVCESWLCFLNFFNDMRKLPGWDENLFMNREIFLDKDKFQLNLPKSERVYSPETCCWLSLAENNSFRDMSDKKVKFIATEKDGTEIECLGVTDFAKERNLNISAISACLNGRRSEYKGMKFRYSDNK